MSPMFFDPTFIILIPAVIFSLYAQMKVKMTFERYSRVSSRSGFTGAQIAEKLLLENGINDVRVERTNTRLGDHYDPRKKVLRLSPEVYGGSSILPWVLLLMKPDTQYNMIQGIFLWN